MVFYYFFFLLLDSNREKTVDINFFRLVSSRSLLMKLKRAENVSTRVTHTHTHTVLFFKEAGIVKYSICCVKHVLMRNDYVIIIKHPLRVRFGSKNVEICPETSPRQRFNRPSPLIRNGNPLD